MILVVLISALAAGAVLLWSGPRRPTGQGSGPRDLPGPGPATGEDDRVAGARPGEDRADPPWWRRALAGRRSARARSTELALVDGLAAALESGLPVPRAVGLVVRDGSAGPASQAWAGLARAADEGQQLAPAWQRLARQTGSPVLSSVARAWQVAALTGAPLADALRVSAHVARERHRLHRAVEVATAGPRATVAVLTLLPLAGMGLAAVLGASPAALYGHPVAQASAGCGAVLILLGQVWVRRMVSAVVRRAS